MRAAWYEVQGPAREVLRVGEFESPLPAPGEVRIRLAASGVNPGDVKKRQDAFGYGMPFPRIIPHSDGAGHVDQVGADVSPEWIGQRVWCYGAQTYRPFGTAAEYTTVPESQIVPLPGHVSFEQGACLGIPVQTAYRAVTAGGSVAGRTVLVQGGAGAVGACAVQFAKRAGATVMATVRHLPETATATKNGADHVIHLGPNVVHDVLAAAPDGVDHIVEVAFDTNIGTDLAVLREGGSLATYASGSASPVIPFWPLVFKNVRLFFLGSDDFPQEAKREAAEAAKAALEAGWMGPDIAERFSLDAIADAHERVERPRGTGRIVVTL